MVSSWAILSGTKDAPGRQSIEDVDAAAEALRGGWVEIPDKPGEDGSVGRLGRLSL